ncbi:MAG TPA: dienelactone hydrolase family protein [Caulobacteraceae bacterium]|nr:dienelactone hydrolase family protein [Caulobacteraceae bacterium]
MTTLATIDGPRVAPASGGAAQSLVIFLHGYGSNGADLIGLAPHWRDALPDTAFVSPNAPELCPGAPGGFQWWGLSSLDHNARAAGARRAAPVLDAFIDAELARAGLSEDRLALVGFSQGTMMALHVGPRRARPLAGIVGYSGMLADEAELASEARTRPPILLVHGDADPMIPIAAFHQARKALGQAGFAVDSHVSPGLGHGIDPAGLQLGGRFLARVLSGPGHLPGAA